MAEENLGKVIPFWSLTTRLEGKEPTFPEPEFLNAPRLKALRELLATFADEPVVTLEAHPLPDGLDKGQGMALGHNSPLAEHLTRLVTAAAAAAPRLNVGAGAETLYRMTVPPSVAAQVGMGLLRPMASKAASGGVHSALLGGAGITKHATFIPVTGAGMLTPATPLILMAAAAAMSVYAEHQRQAAYEELSEALREIKNDALQRERDELNGCRGTIDKATAILLDQGQLGLSLGIDSAVRTIDTAIQSAESRLSEWQRKLRDLGDGPVRIPKLLKAFKGIQHPGGEFRTRLVLAELAIALKKRVIVIQAVEHLQIDEKNAFETFIRRLSEDERQVTTLEERLTRFRRELSRLELLRPDGFFDEIVFTPGEVDDLLRTTQSLRNLDRDLASINGQQEAVIEIVRSSDGSTVVLPPKAIN